MDGRTNRQSNHLCPRASPQVPARGPPRKVAAMRHLPHHVPRPPGLTSQIPSRDFRLLCPAARPSLPPAQELPYHPDLGLRSPPSGQCALPPAQAEAGCASLGRCPRELQTRLLPVLGLLDRQDSSQGQTDSCPLPTLVRCPAPAPSPNPGSPGSSSPSLWAAVPEG